MMKEKPSKQQQMCMLSSLAQIIHCFVKQNTYFSNNTASPCVKYRGGHSKVIISGL